MFIKLLYIGKVTKLVKMETMKKTYMMSFIVAMALFFVGFASATDIADNIQVEMNSVVLSGSDDNVIFAGDTVPVRVTFTAQVDAEDVRVEATINGFRSDISDRSDRFLSLIHI